MVKKRFITKKGFINFDALKASGLSARDVDFSSKKWAKIQRDYEKKR